MTVDNGDNHTELVPEETSDTFRECPFVFPKVMAELVDKVGEPSGVDSSDDVSLLLSRDPLL